MAWNEGAKNIRAPIRLIIRRFSLVVVGSLMAAVLAAPAAPVRAGAMVYTVTTTDDTPSNGNCAVGSCTLRQAIKASNLNDPGSGNQNTIQFANGVNGPILLLNDGSHGVLFVGRDVAITGPTGSAGITVSGNGAVGVLSIGSGVTASIRDLTIANGSASFGGGIENQGTLALTNTSVINNVSGNSGGGIYNATGALTVTNCTFSGNSAHVGGGIENNSGALTITNSTISGNSARLSQGGGIFISGGTATLTNTIVATNTDAMSGNPPDDIKGNSVDPSSGNNLIGIGGSGGLLNGANGNLVGVANPLLGPLGVYGSANGSRTIPLLPGSAAINAGTATGAPPTDQRGNSRVGAVDIGAFESQGFVLTKTSGDNQARNINVVFAPLVVTVTSVSGEPVQGGLVTFTGPASGAGIQSSPLLGTIAANGQASVTPTANAITGGPYAVIASTNGAGVAVSFTLTNGQVTVLPSPQPTVPPASPVNPLPLPRPPGTTGGSPNPLPPPRP